MWKEHEEAFVAARSLTPRKDVQHAPSSSSIAQGIQLMGDLECELQEIACNSALKGQLFSNFREQLEVE